MAEEISKIYGSMVFNDKVMHDRLPKPVYKSLHETIQNGTALDEDSANAVGHREWMHALHALVPTAFRHHLREA